MKKLMVVVDMQHDFCRGALANKAAEAIIPVIKEKIESAAFSYVVFTKDTHTDEYLDTQEGKYLPVKHCIENTPGWEIVDELKPFASNVICKPTFGYINWKHSLKKLFPDESFIEEIEFVGTCTDICVISNALICKALLPDAKIVVDSKACAGLTEEKHNAALEVMRSCQVEVK